MRFGSWRRGFSGPGSSALAGDGTKGTVAPLGPAWSGALARSGNASEEKIMKALVYRGPGLKAIEDRPRPEIKAPGDVIVRMVKTTICGTDLHILKGDVADLCTGPHPRPRRRRRRRVRGRWRYRLPARRSGADLLHLLLRQVRVLPARHVFALHHRRLDSGQRDRRHPGGICAHSARRHQPLPDPRRGRRRGAGDAERHPADRL